jgi:hypothetical protein
VFKEPARAVGSGRGDGVGDGHHKPWQERTARRALRTGRDRNALRQAIKRVLGVPAIREHRWGSKLDPHRGQGIGDGQMSCEGALVVGTQLAAVEGNGDDLPTGRS